MDIFLDEKQLFLVKRRIKSIKQLNKQLESLNYSGSVKFSVDERNLNDFIYKEYKGNLKGHFYHLIQKKYAKTLKNEGLTPLSMKNIYDYIYVSMEMDKIKFKVPKHLEGFYVGKTIRDAEVGRGASVDVNDIICRFKRELVKNYIYLDAESYKDKSYVVLIPIPPKFIEVKTNRTNNEWIPLTEWEVEPVVKLSSHRNSWNR